MFEKLVASLTQELSSEKKRLKQKQVKDREVKISKISELMAESGLSISDLKPVAAVVGKRFDKASIKARAGKRTKVAPKYRLDIEGVEYFWSGRGRTPKVFAEYFSQGNSRESVQIQSL
jgi:DNA-binding protein H-NS